MEPGGAIHQSYFMSDKGGFLARWKSVDKAYTLHETDYKDPPAILIPTSGLFLSGNTLNQHRQPLLDAVVAMSELGGVKDCSSVGFDQHNLNLTGNKAMTLLNARADGHSVPTVFQRMNDDS